MRQLACPWATSPGVARAHTASPTASTPTPENTNWGLVWVAAPPSTGPSSTPKMAAPSAVPINSPRRSAGAAAISHAKPPAHEHAPPMPCTKRMASSNTMSFAKPKATLDTAEQAESDEHRGLAAQTPG